MTHEFKKIINEYQRAIDTGLECVLATVVALDGSSYRRPGVRMLLLSNGKMVGAVSGGCVEKEVFRQAESIFTSRMPKVMTYDGRYRLGCEGILYILLEPFDPPKATLEALSAIFERRDSFELKSFYKKEYSENASFGSILTFERLELSFYTDFKSSTTNSIFHQKMQPCFRLVIVGAEHDAVQLCSIASAIGWEVTVVVHPKEEKVLKDFPGAINLIASEGENLDLNLDSETGIVLMTHSYVKDLKYLIALKNQRPAYFGLLGPTRRREKLFNELVEMYSDIDPDFLENIHGPAGLDIGAETPQEITLSILTEIIAVINKKKVNSLREKEGRIHA